MHRRTGSIYLITVGTAMLVSLMGMAALMKVHLRRAQTEEAAAMLEARTYARAAAALAYHRARTDPNWRSRMAAGTWDIEQPLGNGSFRFGASDPDGSLTDSNYDPVRITATGSRGSARQVVQVTLVPQRIGYDCLDVSLHSAGGLNFENVVFAGRPRVSSAGDVQATDASVIGHVEAAGDISGGTYTESTTSGTTPRILPDGRVFDPYLLVGTPIDYDDLFDHSGNWKRLQGRLLSPAHNPWGAGSPSGVYTIDCRGNNLRIRDARLVATLVLWNVDTVEIQDSVHWETPFPNYPALLVSGGAQLHLDEGELDEDELDTNFNPSNTPYPYPYGSTDEDEDDTYPSRIQGLIYVSGQLQVYGDTEVHGVVLSGGACSCLDPSGAFSRVSLTFDPAFRNNPPPGFEASISVTLEPGSWSQSVD